jgi:hypothetical protein
MKTKSKSNYILDLVLNRMRPKEENWALINQYPYIHAKAVAYLILGPVNYRKEDYFGEPSEYLTDSDFNLLKKGCKQIVKGRGMTASCPLMGLDVSGFNALFSLFHFIPVSRQTDYNFNYKNKKGILDKITFEHRVNHLNTTFFNFIPHNYSGSAAKSN